MTDNSTNEISLDSLSGIIDSLRDVMEEHDHNWYEYSGIGLDPHLEAYFVVNEYDDKGNTISDYLCRHPLKTTIEIKDNEPGGFTIHKIGLFNSEPMKNGDTFSIETRITNE